MSLIAELVVAKLGRGEAGRDLGQGGRCCEHGGAEEDPVHPDPPCDELPALLQRSTCYERDDGRQGEEGERLSGADPLVAGIPVFASPGGPLRNPLATGGLPILRPGQARLGLVEQHNADHPAHDDE